MVGSFCLFVFFSRGGQEVDFTCLTRPETAQGMSGPGDPQEALTETVIWYPRRGMGKRERKGKEATKGASLS